MLGVIGRKLTWLPDDVALRVARVAVEPGRRADPGLRRHRRHGPEPELARADRLAGARAPTISSSRRRSTTPIASEARDRRSTSRRSPGGRAVPVVLYNIPQNTHLPAGAVGRPGIGRHPTDRRDQDSAGDWFAFEEFLAPPVGQTSACCRAASGLRRSRSGRAPTGLISAMASFAPRLLQGVAASVHEDRSRTDTLALQADRRGAARPSSTSRALARRASRRRSRRVWLGRSARPSLPMPPTATPTSVGSSTASIAAPGIRRWLTTHRRPCRPPPRARAVD